MELLKWKKTIFCWGTDAYFYFLKSKNRLILLDSNKKYPKGSLWIQDYNNYDQGHVALVTNSLNNLLESLLFII